MKKLWSYIAMFFIGLSAGLVAMYKLMGDKIEINYEKDMNLALFFIEKQITISAF